MSEKEQESTNQQSPYLIPLAIIAAGGLVGAGIYFGGKETTIGKPEELVEQEQSEGEVAGEELEKTVGDFLVLDEEVCQEDGKPVIYYFGHSRCPHCTWEHPLIKEVAESFGDQISFHDNMDDEEGRDREIFEKYQEINPGYVPFIVLGCKYVRVGSGEQLEEEGEKTALTQLICQLTNNQPSEVCD